tara:strand:- start:147 stop:545 length:399 start_codon:yes stop_codon:yes gene_type:complete
MPLSTVLSKKTNKPVRLDTYQQLLLNAIDTYGSGDWRNNMSIHHKHEQSMFSNILIGGDVVAKVVYEVAHDDISNEDYRAIHIDKTKFAQVSYIAFVNDVEAFRDSHQVTRYRNMLSKFYQLVLMDNKMIKY